MSTLLAPAKSDAFDRNPTVCLQIRWTTPAPIWARSPRKARHALSTPSKRGITNNGGNNVSMYDYLPAVRGSSTIEPRQQRIARKQCATALAVYQTEAATDLEFIRTDQLITHDAIVGAVDREADGYRVMMFRAGDEPFLIGKAHRWSVKHERMDERTIDRKLGESPRVS